jgi:uncharacterized protein with NRDE domain
MCLIGLHLGATPSLMLVANRDEFADRPTAPMHWWKENLLAGKDLRAGGTWLGLHRSGRFAAITNVRDPSIRDAPVPMGSRGLLVKAFLTGDSAPRHFLETTRDHVTGPSPYNLIVGSIGPVGCECWWLGGRTRQIKAMHSGAHVLSNAELNTPWPKAERLLQAMHTINPDAIRGVMYSRETAPDDVLPNTGISLDWEKRLSAALITGDDYHTRSSTFISISAGRASVQEITWSSQAEEIGRFEERFVLEPELSSSHRI